MRLKYISFLMSVLLLVSCASKRTLQVVGDGHPKREFYIILEQRKFPVIEKFHINGGFLIKEKIYCNGTQCTCDKVVERALLPPKISKSISTASTNSKQLTTKQTNPQDNLIIQAVLRIFYLLILQNRSFLCDMQSSALCSHLRLDK